MMDDLNSIIRNQIILDDNARRLNISQLETNDLEKIKNDIINNILPDNSGKLLEDVTKELDNRYKVGMEEYHDLNNLKERINKKIEEYNKLKEEILTYDLPNANYNEIGMFDKLNGELSKISSDLNNLLGQAFKINYIEVLENWDDLPKTISNTKEEAVMLRKEFNAELAKRTENHLEINEEIKQLYLEKNSFENIIKIFEDKIEEIRSNINITDELKIAAIAQEEQNILGYKQKLNDIEERINVLNEKHRQIDDPSLINNLNDTNNNLNISNNDKTHEPIDLTHLKDSLDDTMNDQSSDISQDLPELIEPPLSVVKAGGYDENKENKNPISPDDIEKNLAAEYKNATGEDIGDELNSENDINDLEDEFDINDIEDLDNSEIEEEVYGTEKPKIGLLNKIKSSKFLGKVALFITGIISGLVLSNIGQPNNQIAKVRENNTNKEKENIKNAEEDNKELSNSASVTQTPAPVTSTPAPATPPAVTPSPTSEPITPTPALTLEPGEVLVTEAGEEIGNKTDEQLIVENVVLPNKENSNIQNPVDNSNPDLDNALAALNGEYTNPVSEKDEPINFNPDELKTSLEKDLIKDRGEIPVPTDPTKEFESKSAPIAPIVVGEQDGGVLTDEEKIELVLGNRR